MQHILRPLLLVLCLWAQTTEAYSLKPGDRFPELSLPLLSGKGESSVSSLTEKKLMLHLFASW